MANRRHTERNDIAASETEATPLPQTAPDMAQAGAMTPTPRRRMPKHAGIGNPRTARHQKPDVPQLSGNQVASLGSLEAEILGILWEIGRPASGMEVMEQALYKARAQKQEPISFSTIATTLRRITMKGLLKTAKNEAGTWIYWPTVEREQMAARILNNVSATLLGASLHSLLPRLIGRILPERATGRRDQEDASEEEIARLLRALEESAAHDRKAEE